MNQHITSCKRTVRPVEPKVEPDQEYTLPPHLQNCAAGGRTPHGDMPGQRDLMQGVGMPGGTQGEGGTRGGSTPGLPPAERGRDVALPCPPSASDYAQHSPEGRQWERLERAELARSAVQEWDLRQSNAARPRSRPRPGPGPGQDDRGAPVVYQKFEDNQRAACQPERKRARSRQKASAPAGGGGGGGSWRRMAEATGERERVRAQFPVDPAIMGADTPLDRMQKDISELIFTAYHKTQIEEELMTIQERLHRHRSGEVGFDQRSCFDQTLAIVHRLLFETMGAILQVMTPSLPRDDHAITTPSRPPLPRDDVMHSRVASSRTGSTTATR